MWGEGFYQNSKSYILKRQAWLSRGFGRIFFEPSRRVTNLRQLLLLYRDDPMSQAAIKKRSKDLFEAGFKVMGADKELTEDINRFIKDKFIRMPWKFSRAARDALIYGNGYLEMDFANDENVDRPELEPLGNDIVALHSINPEQMIIIEEDRPDEEDYGRISGYFSMPPLTGPLHAQSFLTVTETHKSLLGLGKRLHPDRIIHIKFDTVGDSNLGLSVLEPAFNIMKSKIDTDEALGVITTKFSKPIIEIIVKKGTKPAEMQRAERMAFDINKTSNKVSHIVHDENLEFKIPGMAGKSLRIKEYYDIMLDQLAIQFGVPKTLLIGSEAGSISGCFDGDSEVLTEDGWMKFDDVNGERVATLDKDMKTLIYEHPVNKIKGHYKGDMVSYNSDTFDFNVTPNHTMLYTGRTDGKYKGVWSEKRADELIGHEAIPRTCVNRSPEIRFFEIPAVKMFKGKGGRSRLSELKSYVTKSINVNMDAWLEFMGYYLSEGCVVNDKGKPQYKIIITQNPEGQEPIRRCLDKLPWHHRTDGIHITIQDKQLWTYLKQFGKSPDKFVPRELMHTSARQLNILLDALMFGDGHVSPNGSRAYYTISKQLSDDVQEIIFKTGNIGNISIRNQIGNPVIINGKQTGTAKHLLYRVGELKHNKHSIINKNNIKLEKHTGNVFCLEMPTSHSLYVRKNGKPSFFGNSSLNLISYFQSIESDQNTIMKPLIMKLLNQWHIATRGEELPSDIDIEFGRLYADEISAVKADMLDTQSVVAAEKAGLITTEGARKKLADVLGIEFSEDEEDYSEPAPGFDGKERGKDNPFKSPQGEQPGIKFPSEEEMDDAVSDIEELKYKLSELTERVDN